eukprot:3935429-Rhodomonas_salina.1
MESTTTGMLAVKNWFEKQERGRQLKQVSTNLEHLSQLSELPICADKGVPAQCVDIHTWCKQSASPDHFDCCVSFNMCTEPASTSTRLRAQM